MTIRETFSRPLAASLEKLNVFLYPQTKGGIPIYEGRCAMPPSLWLRGVRREHILDRHWYPQAQQTLLWDSHLALAGVGALGRLVLNDVIRAGVGSASLADPDMQEPSNLSRSIQSVVYNGKAKAEAAVRDLARSVPTGAKLKGFKATIGEALEAKLLDPDEVSIMVACTDTENSRESLSRFCISQIRGIPFATCGLAHEEKGRNVTGYSFFWVPGRDMGCFSCFAAKFGDDPALRSSCNYNVPVDCPTVTKVAGTCSQHILGVLRGDIENFNQLQYIGEGDSWGVKRIKPRPDCACSLYAEPRGGDKPSETPLENTNVGPLSPFDSPPLQGGGSFVAL